MTLSRCNRIFFLFRVSDIGEIFPVPNGREVLRRELFCLLQDYCFMFCFIKDQAFGIL